MAYAEYSRAGKPLAHQSIQTRFRGLVHCRGRLIKEEPLGLLHQRASKGDPLLLPWIIRTYRDLFLNVGYELRSEEIFRAQKSGVDFEVLVSFFCKTA